MDDILPKIKYNYRLDEFLMHLIQDVTKKSSAEILNFFYELGGQVSEMGLESKKGKGGIHKKISDYFPDTSVPFHMEVRGSRSKRTYNYKTSSWEEDDHFACSIVVSFPECTSYVDDKLLGEIAVSIMEKNLLGGEEMPVSNFPKPSIYCPKMYKSLMDTFSGRPEEKKSKKTKAKVNSEDSK